MTIVSRFIQIFLKFDMFYYLLYYKLICPFCISSIIRYCQLIKGKWFSRLDMLQDISIPLLSVFSPQTISQVIPV